MQSTSRHRTGAAQAPFARRFVTALTVAVALLPGAASLAGPAPQGDVPVLVSTAWVAEHLDDPDVVLLHVAMPGMSDTPGFIPGSALLDYHAIETSQGLAVEMPRPAQLVSVFEAAGVSDGTHVVLYGAGSAHIPARAFVALEYLSHARVSVMDGGLETWRNEGRTLVHDAVTPPRGHLTAKINEDVLADAAWIRDRLEDPGVAIIDARPAAQYEGSSGRNLRPGHIPGAGNLFFADLLESDETPRLKPRNEVEAMFATAGYTPGATVVSYCQIGMRASYNYLIARHLGYDVKLYDGSWQEWGADDSLPAETGRMR